MLSLVYAFHPRDYKSEPGDGINHIKYIGHRNIGTVNVIVKYVMSWKMNSILF